MQDIFLINLSKVFSGIIERKVAVINIFSENIQEMSERYFHDEFVCDSIRHSAIKNTPPFKENCKYRDELREVQKHEGNHQDAKHLYIRGWMQTVNLAVGCIVLGVLIYNRNVNKSV